MRYLFIIIIIIFTLELYSQELPPVRENAAVFVNPQKGIEINAVINESARAIAGTFNRLGRFIIAEPVRIEQAFARALQENSEDPYRRAAELLNLDIYVLVDAYRTGDLIVAEMNVRALSREFKKLEGQILVKSKIAINIPYKLVIEAAYLHRGLGAGATVLRDNGDGTVTIDAGQWHGLKKGVYDVAEGGEIQIVETGRFRSTAVVRGSSGKRFHIAVYPDFKKAAHDAEKRIEYNTEFKYGLENTLLQGTDPEKRFIEGACVINPGANICLPGYGSFLATRYLGFEKNSADMAGVVLSAGLIATHLTLTGFMTGFKTNFFPGVNDGAKEKKIRDLQYFLWGTLPLTFTASYFDQLAYQFSREEYLPPFFRDRDGAATAMSLLIPGGGLFYKGRRLAGWGYYFSEMMLAGYGVYNLGDKRKAGYAFAVLGAVKAVELLNAYLAGPSYEFYNNETERGRNRAGLSFGMIPGIKSDKIYTVSLYQAF